jgi:hypothetical protein
LKFVSGAFPELKDNVAFTSNEADTKGFSEALCLIAVGATDIATAAAPKIQESDTSGSGFGDVSGGGLADAITATEDNKFFAIHFPDLTKFKRYLKCVMTAGDGTVGTNAAVVWLLGRADEVPGGASGQGFEELVTVS